MKTFGEGYRLMVAKNLLFRKNCIILCSECFSTVLGNLLAFVILSAMNKPAASVPEKTLSLVICNTTDAELTYLRLSSYPSFTRTQQVYIVSSVNHLLLFFKLPYYMWCRWRD